MSRPLLAAHDAAVLIALASAGRPVGDGVKGEGFGTPYSVLYPLSGGGRDGSMASPEDDVTVVYQVTCVGVTRQQARDLADRVDSAVREVVIPGRAVTNVSAELPPGVQRDDDVTPPLFYATPRYRISTTPA